MIAVLAFAGALLAAAIAGGVAVWVVYITAKEQRNLEVEKFDWQKKDATFRASVELANRVSSALYEIGSFLESVKYHPERIDDLFVLHESRMKDLMPPVVGAHVAVAAQDFGVFQRFSPLVTEISAFDRCVTSVYREMAGDRRVYALSTLFDTQSTLLSRLPNRVYAVATASEQTFTITLPDCHPPKELSGKP